MSQRRAVEADARDSVVQKQAHPQGIWLAMDATTHQIIALRGGDRRRTSAQQFWAQRPVASRQQATFSTDQSVASAGVIPAEPHRAINTTAWKTHHIERCNPTLRQRVSRWVRRAWSFAKTLGHHLGAIKYFICNDNLLRAKG